MSSTRKGSRGKSRDLYVTPEWCIELLAERLLRFQPTPRLIVDLGAGDGRIGCIIQDKYRRLHQAISFREREECVSVIEDDKPEVPALILVEKWLIEHGWWQDKKLGPPDLILNRDWPHGLCPHEVFGYGGPFLFVSNPPYSQSLEFVEATLEFLEKVQSPGSMAIFLLPFNWFGTFKRIRFHGANPPDRLSGLIPRPSFKGGGNDSLEYAWWWWEYKGENTVYGRVQSYRGTMIESFVDPAALERWEKRNRGKS